MRYQSNLNDDEWIVITGDPQIFKQREREEAMAVYPIERTRGDYGKDEELFGQSKAARFVTEESDVRKQGIMSLVINWPKICREEWSKKPNYETYPILRSSQKLMNIQSLYRCSKANCTWAGLKLQPEWSAFAAVRNCMFGSNFASIREENARVET